MTKPLGIDVHAHFSPETFIRVVEEAGASFGAGVDRSNPKGPTISSATTRARFATSSTRSTRTA